MKKISLWARDHKWPSRIIIVLSIAVLNAAGIIIGSLLGELNVIFSFPVLIAPVAFYFLAVIYYPPKAKRIWFTAAQFYRRQKTCDVVLVASAFCMVLLVGNYHTSDTKIFSTLGAVIPANSTLPDDSTVKTYKSFTAFSESLKDETGKSLKWKEKKKLLKEQVKGIQKAADLSPEGKIALIILSVLVALGLILLVAALACSLSCGGSSGAAILVGLGGTGLVILLLTLAIKGINGKKKKEEKPVLSN